VTRNQHGKGATSGLKSRRAEQHPYGAKASKNPSKELFLKRRDYSGLQVVLCFGTQFGSAKNIDSLLWRGYCAYKMGEFGKAQELYEERLISDQNLCEAKLYLACTLFRLGKLNEAEAVALEGPETPLKDRLLYHLAQEKIKSDIVEGDDDVVKARAILVKNEKKYLSKLSFTRNIPANRLCMAAKLYREGKFTEALDVYQQLLAQDRSLHCLHVYAAMCHTRTADYEASSNALEEFFDLGGRGSVMAWNLRACNEFHRHRYDAALRWLHNLGDWERSVSADHYDVLLHNSAIFSNDQSVLVVFMQLAGAFPEARMNLANYYLQSSGGAKYEEALHLLEEGKDAEDVQNALLRGIAHLCCGQESSIDDMYGHDDNARLEHLRIAEECFLVAGSDSSMENTTSGRQALACHYFTKKQHHSAVEVFDNMKDEYLNDDTFNWNYGLALANAGRYSEARTHLLRIEDETCKMGWYYTMWLCRCIIFCGDNDASNEVWALYRQSLESVISLECQIELLEMIANDSYRARELSLALKAFCELETYLKGQSLELCGDAKRGACVGIFHKCLSAWSNSEDRRNDAELEKCIEELQDAIVALGTTEAAEDDQRIASAVFEWAEDNGITMDLDG
jgi:intraflagellar transport protein 56